VEVSNLLLHGKYLIRGQRGTSLFRYYLMWPEAARRARTNVEVSHTVFNLVAEAPRPRDSVAPQKVEHQLLISWEVRVQSAANMLTT
jgi:hypothetical protein